MIALCQVLVASFMLLVAKGSHAADQGPVTPHLEAQASVLKQLAALQPNHAIHLGSAKIIGDLNEIAKHFKLHDTGPMGRDYSIKMVWAPERERALFTGANHGRPHRLNDVWEFDLGALSWVLLYAPDNPRSYAGLGRNPSDVRFQDGVLVTERGGPAVIGHTWWGITYDEEHRELLFMNTWNTDQSKAIKQLGGNPDERYKGAPLWSFNPQTRQWRLHKTAGTSPRAPFGGMLEYIPTLGGAIWHTNHWQMLATWFYDPGAQAWTNRRANANRGDLRAQSPKTEQVGYYDPEREKIISQRGHDTFEYDVSGRRWRKILEKPSDHESWPNGHDAFAPMYLDPKTGHGLLVDFRSNEFWAYNPEDNWWTKLNPKGADMPKGKKRVAYFDRKHSVFVVIDGLDIWAYRYSL
jgi:hypothetical protein